MQRDRVGGRLQRAWLVFNSPAWVDRPGPQLQRHRRGAERPPI